MARPLQGFTVVEIAGGAAAAYCGRLLADAGAQVTVLAESQAQLDREIVREDCAPERAFGAWLRAGKRIEVLGENAASMAAACARADLVLLGEASGYDTSPGAPRQALIALSWFGRQGPWADLQGSDLLVQALTGLPQMSGPVAGPPLWAGDRQASVIGGVTAYIAATAALLAPRTATPRRYDVSIFEANIVLAEMHMHFFERDGLPMHRHGIGRFHPNSPVGVYPCANGWVGITATTPDQWKSLCIALGMEALAADERLVTRELRFERLDEVEGAMIRALAGGTAEHWAALGRRHKVPIVVVPDAAGILAHPIFAERGSLAQFESGGVSYTVPRTPLALTRTPMAVQLDAPADAASGRDSASATLSSDGDPQAPPLDGITLIDFAMGWAGPLASRLLADLGARLIKIEAGRYPDWWRGVNWTPEYVSSRMYENAKTFCAMNRGKRGVSLDLTTAEGRELALALIAGADGVVENQAAGVMDKLGLGWGTLSSLNPGLVMLSMSAFGIGNAWSDTRAYGSTLEQGAGVPRFAGIAGTTPTMYHLAYGDPIGGLFGCAAMLTALLEKRVSGRGQLVNLSMVETMLPFTTPALLQHRIDPAVEVRRGNRHPVHAPHGFFRVDGEDQWIAVSVADGEAFAALARLLGREDWATDPTLRDAAARRARQDEFEAAIAAWAAGRRRDRAVAELQAAGVAAAPLHHAQELFDEPHLGAAGFFLEVDREFSGPQRQAGVSIRRDGQRLGTPQPAPLMGEHSWEILSERAGVTRERYEDLVARDIITFAPKALRAAMLPSTPPA